MIIFRYLLREIYNYLLGITSILLIIFITNQFERYLRSAAVGHLTMWTVMKVMVFQVPLLIGYLLPLAFYLAILLAFGRLYLDNEMTVLSACGVSRAKLLSVVLFFAAILAIFVAWLMMWVEPIVEDDQGKLIQQAIASVTISKIIPMHFQPIGKSNVIYAEHVDHSKNTLHQVFFAHYQKESSGFINWDITIANKSYEYKNANGDGYFIFDQGHRYVGVPGQLKYQAIQFHQYGLRFLQSLPPLKNWPNNIPTLELMKLEKTNLEAAGTMQWRIAMPLTVIILALIAFPLSRVNPRLGKFGKLIPAILIYTVYADFIFMGRAWIFDGAVSPSIGLWWLHGSFLLLALFLNCYSVGFKRVGRLLLRRRGQYADY
jgi:lipopolysaccharide export system permease protein